MLVTYASFTNKGGREVNEDSFLVRKSANGEYMFVVADGCGGHGFGEVASAAAVNSFGAVFDGSPAGLIDNGFFDTAFPTAQNNILEIQQSRGDHNSMKTTCVSLVISGDRVQWGHIGDSRLYAFSSGKVKTRTLDHSVVQMLVLSKNIKEKEMRSHPDRNKLIRVMGTPWEDKQYVVSPVGKLGDYSGFLLCSDGVWELIEDDTIASLMTSCRSPREWVEAIALEVQRNGEGTNMDNFTAVAVMLR